MTQYDGELEHRLNLRLERDLMSGLRAAGTTMSAAVRHLLTMGLERDDASGRSDAEWQAGYKVAFAAFGTQAAARTDASAAPSSMLRPHSPSAPSEISRVNLLVSDELMRALRLHAGRLNISLMAAARNLLRMALNQVKSPREAGTREGWIAGFQALQEATVSTRLAGGFKGS